MTATTWYARSLPVRQGSWCGQRRATAAAARRDAYQRGPGRYDLYRSTRDDDTATWVSVATGELFDVHAQEAHPVTSTPAATTLDGMTLTQAAARLGITPDTLRQQIARGRLEATKHGRDWWVSDEAVAAYAASRSGRHGRPRKDGAA